jgi:hypothetical protein
MSSKPIKFGGNSGASITKQGKYRVSHEPDGFSISVVIETPDGIRCYPSTDKHPKLVELVNKVKVEIRGSEAGPFFINEWKQVIVPAGNPVEYYYAGEYHPEIILGLDGEEFSGRPHDNEGNLLKPGDSWTGRPRPGIEYILKAGGADIEYVVQVGPNREKICRLSKFVGVEDARRIARKIAIIKGNKGGRFFVNEYGAIFGPKQVASGYDFVFIGILLSSDPWFPKWSPEASEESIDKTTPNATGKTPAPTAADFRPSEKKLEIADGETGHSFESLFSAYLADAEQVTLQDAFMSANHQVANFLRFCELLVKLGSVKKITLVSKPVSSEAALKLESIDNSLKSFGVSLVREVSEAIHDRCIKASNGWEITLGRGLDIYKRPDDWLSIGASDFALRPCHQTDLIFHRLGESKLAKTA